MQIFDIMGEAIVISRHLAELRLELAGNEYLLLDVRLGLQRAVNEVKASVDYTGLKNESERERALIMAMLGSADVLQLQDLELERVETVKLLSANVKSAEDQLDLYKTIIANYAEAHKAPSLRLEEAIENAEIKAANGY